jgi:hypothetical protein
MQGMNEQGGGRYRRDSVVVDYILESSEDQERSGGYRLDTPNKDVTKERPYNLERVHTIS